VVQSGSVATRSQLKSSYYLVLGHSIPVEQLQ
jgi:hypothetical protein